MMDKKNWIFDLYGTLIDVHTDENSLYFWKKFSEVYAVYGAEYTPAKLRDAYRRKCREEQNKLSGEYPEIDLLNVFERLLNEAEYKNDLYHPIHDISWNTMISNTFRVLSRDRMKAYAGTHPFLRYLKENNRNIYLLSNAQASFTNTEIAICGLNDYFDAKYLSSDYGIKKPDPNFMMHLVKEQNLNIEDSVMVGNDFLSDIRIADSVGMDSIFLNTFRYSQRKIEKHMQQVNHPCIVIYSGNILEVKNIGG